LASNGGFERSFKNENEKEETMMTSRRFLVLAWVLVGSLVVFAAAPALAGTAAEIQRDAEIALQKLLDGSPVAKELSSVAKGILVFPRIIKGGLVIGGQYGEGALFKQGQLAGFYNSVAASYGLQIGAQTFGYALFLMTDDALAYLDTSAGFEIGVGPSFVVVDQGVARSLTTTTAKEDIYAFFFDQGGLMAGLGLQGSKISPINPE
jgi:lipid-binding SYLF domain-containing protein